MMKDHSVDKRERTQSDALHKVFNADWEKAKIHGQASRVGFPTKTNLSKCACCLEQIHKQLIPLSENTKQLEVLGFGFPLYYAFIRNCILLLIVTIFSYNLVSVYRSWKQNMQFCRVHYPGQLKQAKQGHVKQLQLMRNFSHQIADISQYRSKQNEITSKQKEGEQNQIDKRCTNGLVSIANVKQKIDTEQDLIRGGSIIINILLLIYLRDKLSKLKQYFDERTTSPSDFSILVSNIPLTVGLRRKLQNQIKNDLKVNEIVDTIVIPDMQQYQKLQHEKEQIMKHLRKSQQKNQLNSHYQQQFQKVQRKIQSYLDKASQQYRRDELPSGQAIVIIQTEPKSKQLISNFQSEGFTEKGWEDVQLREAPEPRQIIWQNISVHTSKRRGLVILGWSLSFLLLIILTVVFAIVSKAKAQKVDELIAHYNKTLDKSFYYKALFIVLGMIFAVVMINKLLISTLFHKFTDMQRHLSNHEFQFSYCLKYCLGLFFTTALMTIIVQAFLLKNYFSQDYGVIEQQSIMFAVNSIFVPFFWLINPSFLVRKFKQWRSFGNKHFTQQEANHLMEFPQYDIGKRYGQILQVMWFTYLYTTLVPIGAFFSVIGLFLYYWVDKYNLLRRSTLHSQVSGKLVDLTLSMLDFTIVLRNLGEVLFDIQVRNKIRPISLVFLSISIIYQLLPISWLISYFNPQKFNQQQTPYSKAKEIFRQNYYDFHLLHNHKQKHEAKTNNLLSSKNDRSNPANAGKIYIPPSQIAPPDFNKSGRSIQAPYIPNYGYDSKGYRINIVPK